MNIKNIFHLHRSRGFVLIDVVIGMTIIVMIFGIILWMHQNSLLSSVKARERVGLQHINEQGIIYARRLLQERKNTQSTTSVSFDSINRDLSTTSANTQLYAPSIDILEVVASTLSTKEIRHYDVISTLQDNFELCTLRNIFRLGGVMGFNGKNLRDIALVNTIRFGSGLVTDVVARTGRFYITLNSPIRSDPDFVVIDNQANVLYSTTTGPGYEAIALRLPFVFLANTGADASVHILRQSDARDFQFWTSWIGRSGTSSPPWPQTLDLYDQTLYVGFEKHNGHEVAAVDVSNVSNYSIYEINSAETNTLINAISQSGDRIYVAGSDIKQLRIYDKSLNEITSVSPSGFAVQEGRAVTGLHGAYFGRTVGGFNNRNNHELFVIDSYGNIASSHDVPGGVYDLISFGDRVLIASASTMGVQLFEQTRDSFYHDSPGELKYIRGWDTGPARHIACNESLFIARDNEVRIYEMIYE